MFLGVAGFVGLNDGHSLPVGFLVIAESSKRHKTTVSRPNYNTKKFQSKVKSNLYRDFYVSRTVHLERNVQPSELQITKLTNNIYVGFGLNLNPSGLPILTS
ncbi:unnamed protein product [Camellia sinensis]